MASEYHRGDMDIHEQQNTYHAFGVASKWGSLAIAVGVLFFTLLFCTATGFMGAAVTAVVVAAVGIAVLREKKGGGH